jgi:hypothetical protein
MTAAVLLDVNVLVALFDPDHIHHEAAHRWFRSIRKTGWATCPITENGVARILSNAAYGANHEPAERIVEKLRAFRASGFHRFWPDDVSLCDNSIFAAPLPAGHRQVTDIYLLALAKRHAGRLATFDRTIPFGAVKRARADDLMIIPA